MVPIRSARTKRRMVVPPIRSREESMKIIVKELLRDLTMVSLMARFISDAIGTSLWTF